jgi:hypothetical protein
VFILGKQRYVGVIAELT